MTSHGTSYSDALIAAYRAYVVAQKAVAQTADPMIQVRRLAKAVAAGFPKTFSEWQFLNDQLWTIWQQQAGSLDQSVACDFTTNGSTQNVIRRYRFGPHGHLWIRALWSLACFPLGFRELIRLAPSSDGPLPVTISADPTGKYPHTVSCGPLTKDVVAELVEVLDSYLKRFPACSLISVPDSFLYLNQEEKFQEFAVANRHRFNLISQNWEPFYKRRALRDQGVHINDMMMDWTSGMNFFTCPVGELHVYPVFAAGKSGRVNLLNLIAPDQPPTPEEQDRFLPHAVVHCGCGQRRLAFEFIPHPSKAIRTPDGEIIYDPAIVECLTGQYRSLQFIQHTGHVTIFHQGEPTDSDRRFLEAYFGDRGLTVVWRADDVCQVGLKRPVFYRAAV